jgi:hypothetical protein
MERAFSRPGVNLDFEHRVIRNGAITLRDEEGGPPTAGVDSFRIPDRVEFRAGNPNFVTDNTQFGAYLQDDWAPTQRLTLNLGIRWDYETRMLNFDYATPQPIVDSLTKYAKPPFHPGRSEALLHRRHAAPRFTGAFQPRLGFSYSSTRLKTGLRWVRHLLRPNAVRPSGREAFAQQQPNIIIPSASQVTPRRRVDWNDAYLTGRAALVYAAHREPAGRRSRSN